MRSPKTFCNNSYITDTCNGILNFKKKSEFKNIVYALFIDYIKGKQLHVH